MKAITEATERVSLYYREGSSDKVYQAAIEPAGSQFVVNFAYGRRGNTLTTGTKTSSPVDHESAKKIYGKLVGEKKAKGYTEGADGTPYQHADKQASGILPKLQAEVDLLKVSRLSKEDILAEANSLSDRWPSLPLDERRKVAEAICKKIVIGQEGKDRKISITYSGRPSSEQLCKNLTSL